MFIFAQICQQKNEKDDSVNADQIADTTQLVRASNLIGIGYHAALFFSGLWCIVLLFFYCFLSQSKKKLVIAAYRSPKWDKKCMLQFRSPFLSLLILSYCLVSQSLILDLKSVILTKQYQPVLYFCRIFRRANILLKEMLFDR